MNRNQLEKLNKVLKMVIENSAKNPNVERLNEKIEALENELKAIESKKDKTADDNEEIRAIKREIKFYNDEIEEEQENSTAVKFKSEKVVKNKLVEKLFKEYKENTPAYKETLRNWRHSYGLWVDYECDSDKKYADFEFSRLKQLEQEFKTKAEQVVKDMEESGEFEQYYLINSGKQEYLNKVAKMEKVKSVQSKLNDIIENYSVKFAMLTAEDFKTYVEMWNEYLNEPCGFEFKPLYKVKYLNKLYEVYKYEVENSVLHDRIQCYTVDGIKKDLSNIYLKEIGEVIEIVEAVKPLDVISYKGEIYEVYKINVVGSELHKRVKAKSTISNKTRDLRNYYFKKVN